MNEEIESTALTKVESYDIISFNPEKNIYAKLQRVKSAIGVISRDASNAAIRSKYVSLDKLLAVINPVLADEKLLINIIPLIDENFSEAMKSPWFKVQATVYDTETGNSIINYYTVPMDEPIGDNKATKKIFLYGSSMTYMQRYVYQMLLSIPMSDDPEAETKSIEDDDVWFHDMLYPALVSKLMDYRNTENQEGYREFYKKMEKYIIGYFRNTVTKETLQKRINEGTL